MSEESGRPGPDLEDEPPPVLGRWRNLYALVIGVLAALIALFAWLTRKLS